ncbi:MAG: MOSC domain-containing protein [Candidatus Poseidoniaceae archaeon]
MGILHGIFVSQGGVPKHSIESCMIDSCGIVNDKQENPKYHGGPERAICLLDYDVLLKLQNEGHPITPGSTGENLLISGCEMDIGKKIFVDEVVLEILSAASPCYKIADSFLDGEFNRFSNKKHPYDTRWYCKVISEGEIKISSEVGNL